MKSYFDYELITTGGQKIILIVDLKLGTSVTNNMQNVLKEILEKEKTNLAGYLVFYKDNWDLWDGYCHRTDRFIILNETSFEGAVKAYNLLPVKQKARVISINS